MIDNIRFAVLTIDQANSETKPFRIIGVGVGPLVDEPGLVVEYSNFPSSLRGRLDVAIHALNFAKRVINSHQVYDKDLLGVVEKALEGYYPDGRSWSERQ